MAKSKVSINEYTSSLPPKVREWITKVDKIMRDNGCRTASGIVSNTSRTTGKFTYTSKKTQKTVCIINIDKEPVSKCGISMRGYHYMNPNSSGNILDELPGDMLDIARHKKTCGCRNPDLTINPDADCVHGTSWVYTYRGDTFAACAYGGPTYTVNEAANFEILTKWIELESAFAGEIKTIQLPRRPFVPLTFPHDLRMPLTAGDWTMWSFRRKHIDDAEEMVVEYEGTLSGEYSVARIDPQPWKQFNSFDESGKIVFTEEPGKIIINLSKIKGTRLGFALWNKSDAAKVKRVYLQA